MKNSYRGVSYQSSAPTLEATENEITSQFRGDTLNFSYVRHIPMPPLVRSPINRVTSDRIPQARTSQSQAKVIDQTAVAPQLSEKILHDVSLIHQANIRRNLEHRLQVAKAKGDKSLIRQLEVESKQLTF